MIFSKIIAYGENKTPKYFKSLAIGSPNIIVGIATDNSLGIQTINRSGVVAWKPLPPISKTIKPATIDCAEDGSIVVLTEDKKLYRSFLSPYAQIIKPWVECGYGGEINGVSIGSANNVISILKDKVPQYIIARWVGKSSFLTLGGLPGNEPGSIVAAAADGTLLVEVNTQIYQAFILPDNSLKWLSLNLFTPVASLSAGSASSMHYVSDNKLYRYLGLGQAYSIKLQEYRYDDGKWGYHSIEGKVISVNGCNANQIVIIVQDKEGNNNGYLSLPGSQLELMENVPNTTGELVTLDTELV